MSVEERLTRLETIITVLAKTGQVVNPKYSYEYGISYEDMKEVITLLADIKKELREAENENGN